jgi:hypothetical protein
VDDSARSRFGRTTCSRRAAAQPRRRKTRPTTSRYVSFRSPYMSEGTLENNKNASLGALHVHVRSHSIYILCAYVLETCEESVRYVGQSLHVPMFR